MSFFFLKNWTIKLFKCWELSNRKCQTEAVSERKESESIWLGMSEGSHPLGQGCAYLWRWAGNKRQFGKSVPFWGTAVGRGWGTESTRRTREAGLRERRPESRDPTSQAPGLSSQQSFPKASKADACLAHDMELKQWEGAPGRELWETVWPDRRTRTAVHRRNSALRSLESHPAWETMRAFGIFLQHLVFKRILQEVEASYSRLNKIMGWGSRLYWRQ